MKWQRLTYRLCVVMLLCLAEALMLTAYGQDIPRAERRRREGPLNDSISLQLDTNPVTPQMLEDSLKSVGAAPKLWVPNPTKATWMALVIPGGGQIYNRKYWKLPIFYGGFVGCTYALTWNNRMYKDYANAYKDAVNNNWSASSITELLPASYISRTSKTQVTETLRKRKDMYRRYRDLSIFAFIGVYALSVVDAYVDAELSNFDISPDLSMRVEPTLLNGGNSLRSKQTVGVQCSFTF
ncbi:MAG: DUF5683 domain-containing protein [Bacteroidales bacterium]|nr:hypothetical protein [Bacteroidaceae bacterium]MBR3015243.1 hypothetical protein [Bacteroidaceae bacterium]MBR3626078.1 hypothetical protein [Bacteroidaceae bacterium]MDO4186663.1 DUF5683 domain-containing protein [Bacteroidales bacterium]